MRTLPFAWVMMMLTWGLAAQVPAPEPEPPWLITLREAQQTVYQAPLGSLDAKVDAAWAAARQAPSHMYFGMAADLAAGFYRYQGYELKAERILRDAISLVPETEPQSRKMLRAQLASHFEGTQQTLKAVEIREALASEPASENPSARSNDLTQLANLYEQIGEMDKAEAAWKEAAALRKATQDANERQLDLTRLYDPTTMIRMSGVFSGSGYASGRPNELADFYSRHGRAGEADAIYKDSLAKAAQTGSEQEWIGVAQTYSGFLTQNGRWDDAMELLRESIARAEGSADASVSRFSLYGRQTLANLLVQAGRADQGLAMQREYIQAAQAAGSAEYAQSLITLANMLVNLNRLDDAEKMIGQVREAAAADAPGAPFHESMATQILARIRDLQQRPEEARHLRNSAGVPNLSEPADVDAVQQLSNRAHMAAMQGNLDEAIALADRALAAAGEPGRFAEASGIMTLVNVLGSRERPEEARRIALSASRLIEQATPRDHPRIADSLGGLAQALVTVGLTGEARQAIARQEKILIAAKGDESPALNSVTQGRVALLRQASDFAGAIEELKRSLARTEKAAGPRGSQRLFALREVAWAYPMIDNWPEEERVLTTLRERTVRLFGERSLDHSQLLVQMANRASQNLQHDQALAWIDEAIEMTRALSGAEFQLPGLIQNREAIVQAKNAPPGATPAGFVGSVPRTAFAVGVFDPALGQPRTAPVIVRPSSVNAIQAGPRWFDSTTPAPSNRQVLPLQGTPPEAPMGVPATDAAPAQTPQPSANQ